MLAGWLLAAALAYRIRGSGPGRRWVAAGLVTTALAVATLPAYEFCRIPVDGPGQHAPGSLVLGCAVAALAALTAAALITVRRKDAGLEHPATAN